MTYPPACTIVSNNYLALARVLADSYRAHHPGAEVFVCVADRPWSEIQYESMPFHTIFAQDLGIPSFLNLAFRSEIIELNTAIKPYLFSYLKQHYGMDRAFYFDSDILILGPLDELVESLEKHSAVLTPHITEGLPDDGFRPSERIMLFSGVYNLGFLGLKLDASTEAFLQWWQQRLHRWCVQDIHNGLSLDQRWMDFAPAFLPSVDVQRSPAYNIAYWNLSQRRMQRDSRGWSVNGMRAGFFHFSGIVFDHLGAISRYQNRISSSTNPEVMPLLEEFRDQVSDAGHESFRTIPYGFGMFSRSGLMIAPVLRRALRRVDPLGLRWSDPFDDAQGGFVSWLTEPLSFPEGTLNRAVLFLWESRPDLIDAFPSVWGSDLPSFVEKLSVSTLEWRGELEGHFLPIRQQGERNRNAKASVRKPGVLPLNVEGSKPNTGLETIDLTDPPGPAAAWLNEIIPAREQWPHLSRLALRLYEIREDVQNAFPDPLGSDQQSFARWFVLSASREYGLARGLVRPVLTSFPLRDRITLRLQRFRFRRIGQQPLIRPVLNPAREQNHPQGASLRGDGLPDAGRPGGDSKKGPAPPRRGVNLAGYFASPSGVGQVARGTAAALERAGIPVARVPLDADWWSRIREGVVDQPAGAPYDVTIMHINADETPNALRLLPVSTVVSSYLVGCWYWELSHFPLQFADRFSHLDEVWAPSRFCHASFEGLASIPVRYVPPFVPAPRSQTADRGAFGLDPNRFYFLVTFDVFSVVERKNPFAVIEAFRYLTEHAVRDVGLIVRINQASHDRGLLGRLQEAGKGIKIHLLTGALSRGEIDNLLACADAYVSLHRSEGLGLPMIESMYLRKPVVATNYGGVTDFLDESTGFPVPYRLVHLDRDHPPYPSGAVWADPDTRAAAENMLRVVEDPEDARERSEQAFDRVTALYGIEAAAERFDREVHRILEQPSSS